MKEANDLKQGEFNDHSDSDNGNREEVYTKIVRAGNRTYFFDVKETRKSDLYLTITESKKRFGKDGKFFFEKHKIFLYKEDFEKFAEGLRDSVSWITANLPPEHQETEPEKYSGSTEKVSADEFINVEFEDLGEK
jgi:hypothetical protein